MKQTHHVCTPAYGNKYTTASEVKAAFFSGVDFRHHTGTYCSIRNMTEGDTVELRYGTKLNRLTVVEIP